VAAGQTRVWPPPPRAANGVVPRPEPRSPRSYAFLVDARATAGAVTPGFTKAEILKPPKDNPWRGGLFERVAGLLETC